LIWKSDTAANVLPTWVSVKKDATVVTKIENSDTVLDVLDIKEATGSSNNMCKMQISQVDVPEEFMTAGFKLESYCCIKFNTGANGMTTFCNTNKPRCWYEIRTFGRLLRKICLKNALTKAGLPVDTGLAEQK